MAHFSQELLYPFGMMMPGRKYEPTSGYRYGFNGKENDNEIKGEGNQQDYGLRIYDPRLGRFLSVDALAKKYPELTPYQFASNKPIKFIDLDGAEAAEEEFNPEESEREWDEMEENIRENLREKEERERELHIRRMNTDPQYRATQAFFNNLMQSQARETYWRSAFNSASVTFTGGGIQENRKNGDAWDNAVRAEMLKNPTCVGVGRQISIKVVGLINGKTEVANIRIDNVGIRVNPVTNEPIFDFKEAKYSIGEIKEGNIIQTLTPQQKSAVNILINGSDVNIFIRGEGSAAKLNNIMSSTEGLKQYKLSNGQSIFGQIGEIKVVVPSGTINSSTGITKPANPTSTVKPTQTLHTNTNGPQTPKRN